MKTGNFFRGGKKNAVVTLERSDLEKKSEPGGKEKENKSKKSFWR